MTVCLFSLLAMIVVGFMGYWFGKECARKENEHGVNDDENPSDMTTYVEGDAKVETLVVEDPSDVEVVVVDNEDVEPKVKRKARKNYGTRKNRNSKRHND